MIVPFKSSLFFKKYIHFVTFSSFFVSFWHTHFQCKEIPTILQIGGCKYPGIDSGEKLIQFEANMLNLQLTMEDSFFNIAKSTGENSVIIQDRGLFDPKAYMPQETWYRILEKNGWKEEDWFGRYYSQHQHIST